MIDRSAPLATAPNGTHAHPASAPEPPRLIRLAQLLDDFEADADAAHRAHTMGQPRGPRTGFRSLDQALGGFLQPGLHVLHSNSGTGKTALGWQIATTARHPALFVSCEMSALELFRRLIARATDTPLHTLKTGEIPPAEARQLAERAIANASQTYLVDATLTYARADYLLEVSTLAKASSPHFLLVLDSLHAWVEMNPEPVSEYDAINAGLAALRQLAHQLACPVLVIAERSRAAMKDGGLNASAGSRRFEYGSESVIGMDKKGATDPSGATPIELVFDKNRHGASGQKIKLHFLGSVQHFKELPDA